MTEAFPKSSMELKNIILSLSINSLKFNTFVDNFDSERFNFDGTDRSKNFNTFERVYWISWFFENYEKLYSAFSLFNTDNSKRLFLNLLAFRIAGHHSIRLETSFNENSDLFKSYIAIEKHTASELPTVGMFGKLRHYDFIHKGNHYVADCLGFKYYLHRGQYFFNDGDIRIEPKVGDVVIDAGACFGETAIVFGKVVGLKGKVFAFEPVDDHLEVLRRNITQNPDCNIEAMPYGLSNSDVDWPPIKLNKYSPGFSTRNQNVPLRCLDGLVIRGLIPLINYIKLDIEGGELSAINGATGSIRSFRPKLAVSIYHKPDDIFEIPLYIAKEFPFYDMFIDHYTIHSEETVLYCAPK